MSEKRRHFVVHHDDPIEEWEPLYEALRESDEDFTQKPGYMTPNPGDGPQPPPYTYAGPFAGIFAAAMGWSGGDDA